MIFGTRKKVFVGMSGGVDSAVAALLLKRRGFDVAGVFIRSYNLDGCEEKDAEDARRAAGKIGIPFYVWNFKDEYRARVVSYTIDGYRRGITPNPDVMCNKEIKFGLFLKKALEMGANYIATGHYVRLVTRKNFIPSTRFGRSDGGGLACPRRATAGASLITAGQARSAVRVSENKIFSLAIAKDKNKDQSYFLWTLAQSQLKRCLFPIGNFTKQQVRNIARGAGLHLADKKDSQGICFLGKITLEEFLGMHLLSERGLIKDVSGKTVGRHRGSHFYTIGQRHGIGISGAHPYYVAEKDARTNTLVVAQGRNHKSLQKKLVLFSGANWISGREPEAGTRLHARVRYRQPLAPARLTDSRTVTFDEPQRFVAPGQSVVFYTRGGEMIGGGIIERAE